MLDILFDSVEIGNEGYGDESLRVFEFSSPKEFKRVIKDAERLVRTSVEYKRWVGFVHGVLGTNYVCYYSGELPISCHIELHHHPYTLFEIVSIVINNFFENNRPIDTFLVAEYVIALHYLNMIGFIPLAKTYHEKYHAKALQIPISLVEGNWHEFEKHFKIPQNLKTKINYLCQYDNTNNWFIKQAMYNKLVIVKGGVK